MATESTEQWHCRYCSAYFLSRDSLERHIDEYRERAKERAKELEDCQVHANIGAAAAAAKPEDGTLGFIVYDHVECPFENCRKGSSEQGMSVRQHFLVHISCHEMCLDCHIHVSNNASKFFKHAQKCRGKTPERKQYITSVKRSFRARSDNRLLELLRDVPNALRMFSYDGKTTDTTRNRTLEAPVYEAPESNNQERLSKRRSGQHPGHQHATLPPPGESFGISRAESSACSVEIAQTDRTNNQLGSDTLAANPESTASILGANFISPSHNEQLSIEMSTTAATRQVPVEEATMRSEILAYMLSKLPGQHEYIERYVRELTPQRAQDLKSTIFDDIGLPCHNVENAFKDLWHCLEASQAFRMEKQLEVPRSTCMSVDVDPCGDWEVKVKVDRHQGLRLVIKYRMLIHADPPVSRWICNNN